MSLEEKKKNESKEKDKALSLVLGQIERNFGRGSIMRLGDASRMKVETISTGALTLDLALGGGYPKGRVVEVYGPESSGKTTLSLHAIAEVQKNGGVAAFVDAEHALDPVYAASLGVDVENLLVSQPDTGEMALEIVDQLIRSSAVDLVVVDSVAALTPRAEIEGEMGDHVIGSQARLMSQAMRKITGNIGKSGCTVIFLNQFLGVIGLGILLYIQICQYSLLFFSLLDSLALLGFQLRDLPFLLLFRLLELKLLLSQQLQDLLHSIL